MCNRLFNIASARESKRPIILTYFYNGWICDIDRFFCFCSYFATLRTFSSFVGLFAGWVDIYWLLKEASSLSTRITSFLGIKFHITTILTSISED